MKKDQYRFQMNNLAWTFLTIMLVVVQMCSILQNLFAGAPITDVIHIGVEGW
eukprot:SAG31_NODE_250_length_19098_cov_4.337123_15_plen_52_part_00